MDRELDNRLILWHVPVVFGAAEINPRKRRRPQTNDPKKAV